MRHCAAAVESNYFFELSQFDSPMNTIAILGNGSPRVGRGVWKARLKSEHESVFSDHFKAPLTQSCSYENMVKTWRGGGGGCVFVLLNKKTFGQETAV